MSLHKPTVFTGVATAMITPFSDGSIDFVSLAAMIEEQIAAGVSGILVAGTTGESTSLTVREHYELVRFAKEQIGGRTPLLAGCGSNVTAHAIEHAKAVCEAGADALLAVTPYYNKCNDRGIILHYRALADAVTRPLMLYNVPSRTGFSMKLEHYRELASHPNIVAVKEASGNLELMDAILCELGDRLDVYTGNDHQTVASMRLGASGVISVYSNIEPRTMAEICRLCASGEMRSAGQKQRAVLPQMKALFCEVNPIPVKYVASLRGMCKLEYRLPLCPPCGESAKTLQKLFG